MREQGQTFTDRKWSQIDQNGSTCSFLKGCDLLTSWELRTVRKNCSQFLNFMRFKGAERDSFWRLQLLLTNSLGYVWIIKASLSHFSFCCRSAIRNSFQSRSRYFEKTFPTIKAVTVVPSDPSTPSISDGGHCQHWANRWKLLGLSPFQEDAAGHPAFVLLYCAVMACLE